MANILVVDDEESIGEVVELNLTLEGHRVKRFTSAEKAMEEFNRPGVKFDIAILDYYAAGYQRHISVRIHTCQGQ